MIDGLLCYLSDPDEDPTARFYIPEQIQDAVIRQYNDGHGHVGIDKTFEAISLSKSCLHGSSPGEL